MYNSNPLCNPPRCPPQRLQGSTVVNWTWNSRRGGGPLVIFFGWSRARAACVVREFSAGDACSGCVLANSLLLPGLCFECSAELCESACKSDPVRAATGVQDCLSAPQRLDGPMTPCVQMLFSMFRKSEAGIAAGGGDRGNSAGSFWRRAFDQKDQPELSSIARDGSVGCAFGGDVVRLCAQDATASEDAGG